MKINCILLLTILLSASAQASTPQGAQHGPWHVTSISSLSGGGDDADAAVLFVQEVDGDELKVRWDQGYPVIRISISISACSAYEDFEHRYSVPLYAWQVMPIGARARHLKKTFGTWIEQARLSCSKRTSVGRFQLKDLNGASDDFNHRLDFFHRQVNSRQL